MSAKTRRIAYMATAGGVALALMAGVTIAANVQSNNLDLLLGRGKQHIQKNGDLTAEYIDFTYETQEEALKNAQDMTQLTAEEGMTLLKNDNALPNEGREPRDYGLDRRFQSKLASLSLDEEKRVKLHAQIVPARELCLENAVSQVWLAVELLPNESDELAETLCEAGKWTENREPDVSKRIYEALLERCSSTRLGQEAQATRWFPKGE